MACNNTMADRCYVITFERNLYCTVVCDYEELQFDKSVQSLFSLFFCYYTFSFTSMAKKTIMFFKIIEK